MKVRNILQVLARFTRAKEAVSALEYAIVVGVVVGGIGGAVVAFTDVMEAEITQIGTNVQGADSTVPAVAAPASPTPGN